MAYSVGDELCMYLQAQSVGNFNGVGTVNLFSTLMPDQPDLAACVIERGGLPALLTLTGQNGPESKFDQPTVMVRVRSGMDGYAAGNNLAQLIYKTLQGVTETTLNAGGSLFHLIVALQFPMYLGRDERQRHMWSQNFRIMVENAQR